MAANRNGVGMLINKSLKYGVVDVKRRGDRIILVKLVVEDLVLNVISAYAPQVGHNENTKREFWEGLEDMVRTLPIGEKLVIGGDLNGRVGASNTGFEGAHGGFGYGIRNQEGEDVGQQSVCFVRISDQSDSQNKSEEQVNLSEGTSPSSSYDEGSKSTASNLPKAATRSRRKRNCDSEDKDYVAAEEEANSKKKVLKKEYVAVATKPGPHKKAPAKRVPMSKARSSTQETMEFTLEPKEAGEGKKRKERVKKTIAKVIGRSSMIRDPAEDEEEETAFEQLQEEAGERKGQATTDAFQRVPRG
nr:craniofacial development protein 2-like [Aegilops tauschii subsp. strangulata]